MKAIDVLTAPWAIIPEQFFEIREIYSTHLRGEKVDIKEIEAKVRQSLQNEREPYHLINDIAIIPIHGIVAKRMNLFTKISGGVSTQLVGQDIQTALDDSAIKGILLDIDSPGGTVDGTQELANMIFEGRARKPIIAFTDGLMASAAYWIGSAADKVYISGDTPHIGSIGVVAAHIDYSAYEKKIGIKTTEIYAGKYKRIASQYKPLSEEGKQTIQDRVDYIYSIFVDQVGRNRGVSSETVLKNMADGKIFIGRQAITAGLVDGITTFSQAINGLADGEFQSAIESSSCDIEDELALLNEKLKDGGAYMLKDTDFKNLPLEKQCRIEWDRDPVLRDEFIDDFECYFAYRKAEADGRIRIIGSGR
ncbi:MAG: signal peptide peptidase SppA [bacterium]|nr:MAG: signal peptide peptidase SppA [bacterium]